MVFARAARPPGAIAASRFPASRFPRYSNAFAESFQMMPVELVEATGTLLMAFSEGIDYTVLYAIEQMLGYHTEPCLVCPSTLKKSLQALARHRQPTSSLTGWKMRRMRSHHRQLQREGEREEVAWPVRRASLDPAGTAAAGGGDAGAADSGQFFDTSSQFPVPSSQSSGL